MRIGSVDEMISTIGKGKGFANTNLFFVMMPIEGGDAARTLNFLCTSITLPSRQLQSLDRQIGADRRSIAYGFANPEVSMNFRVLNDQNVRDFFENWQNSIVTQVDDNEGNYDIAFPKDYVRPIKIYQLKKGQSFPIFNADKNVNLGPIRFDLNLDIDLGIKGKSTYEWVLEDAYPVTFQQETLADGPDAISEITIEFTYRRWKGSKITDSSLDIGLDIAGSVKNNIKEKIGNKIYDVLG